MTVALVDADIVAYRCSASAEHDAVEIALIRADKTLKDITSVTDADDVRLFLSGSSNFRKELYPEYKANRIKMVRPRWLESVREYLVLTWGAIVTDGYEADDAIGIAMGQCDAEGSAGVCVSIDKDLYQLPGLHYHFVDGTFRRVEIDEGWQNFYRQMLTGDRADNIPGITGIGKVRAAKLTSGLDESSLFECVKKLYNNNELFLRNARLLYVWRKPQDDFKRHLIRLETMLEERPEGETKSVSTVMTPEEIIPSTEHGGTKGKKDGSPRRGRSKGSVSGKKRHEA